MKLIEGLNQNTTEWDAFRAEHFGASEAAAMLGLSPYMTRDKLLRQKKTGIRPEVSGYQQAIFDKGHQIEALLRPIAEKELGKELFPCVGVLEGTKLSASFDGLTMDESLVWEHKLLNDKLRECLPVEGASCEALPLHYKVQLEQQLLVSGAEKALFWASDFNEVDDWGEKIDCRYGWYTSDSELRQRIIHGWQQFEKDLEAYEVKERPAVLIGQTPEALNALPVLHIAASGQLVASNLDDFKEKALTALAQINTDLQTDQDFADAEQSVKYCKQIESLLSKAKESLYSGAGIALVINELEAIAERFKQVRLQQEKAIKSEKENRKQALIEAARQRVITHIKTLNEGLPDEYALAPSFQLTSDLTAAIKGLKSLSSMQNALDSVVLEQFSAANQAFQQQQAQAIQDESRPPVSSSEAELAQLLAVPEEGVSLAQVNKAIYPLQVLNEGHIYGLLVEAADNDWQGIKQALIDHLEKAIPA